MLVRVSIVVLAALPLTACSSPPIAPEMIVIAPGSYERAFAIAQQVARDAGLAPALRDIRAGIIETDPATAPTMLEPWRFDGESPKELLASTLGHQRRRARFAFGPPDAEIVATPAAEPPPPDLLASNALATDLTAVDGALELRVRVFVEREQLPGTRRSTWTRSASSRAVHVDGDGARDDGSRPFWVTVSRDPVAEARLLAAVEGLLAAEGRLATP